MLAIQDIGDWIEGIIVLVIIAGSALSGIGKAIVNKLNRSREEAEAQRRREGQPRPQRVTDRPAVPPVARPMPPRRPASTIEHRPVAWPLTPPTARRRPHAEVPQPIPPVLQTILDVVLDGGVELETVVRKPRPPQPAAEPPVSGSARTSRVQPPPAPRPSKTKVPKLATRRRSIEDREEQKAKLVEKRLGHVVPHVASTTPLSSTGDESVLFDRPTRTDLRRAIILNELLSPPLALRRLD